MGLSFQVVDDSLDSLKRALHVSDDYLTLNEQALDPLQETLRAGVIQQFEVAYEQTWKLLQRWVRENIDADQAEHPRTRKDLFRLAAQYRLIDDPLPWFSFGDARNLTSHTYDQTTAHQVFLVAHQFLPNALLLIERLKNAAN